MIESSDVLTINLLNDYFSIKIILIYLLQSKLFNYPLNLLLIICIKIHLKPIFVP